MPRVIRKLDIAERPTFDEQLWPINALLVVLSALVAGVIIGTSEFTAELSWRNGWLRLATLVASVALLIGLAWWFRGRIGRRFQLGAAASLLLHAAVGILLYFQHLDLFQSAPSRTRRETESALVHYEYQIRTPDERTPREAHERPIDTTTPENRPIELTRTPTAEPRVEDPRPQPLPQTTTSVEPTQMDMRRNEFAAPKRADSQSLLSRSTTQTPIQPSQRVSAPEQQAAADPTARLEARASALERAHAAQPESEQAQPSPAPAEVRREAPQLARRTNTPTTEPAITPRATAMARALTAPGEVSSPSIVAAPASPAQSASPKPLEAKVSDALPRDIASPPNAKEIAAVSQPVTADVAAIAPRPAAVTEPTIASTPGTAAPDRDVSASAGSAAAVAQPSLLARSAPAESQAGPAPTEISRTSADAPMNAATETAAAAPSSRADLLQTLIARRQPTSDPQIGATGPPADTPSRDVASTANAASPATIDSPAISPAAADNAPSQAPTATSLSRTTLSATGIGQSPNFDRALPAPANNDSVASAAAERAASTIEAGAAPAASSASIHRSPAQAHLDAATALAQDVARADYRAAAAVSQLEATSGGAPARFDSAAPSSTMAADAGNLPADTGAARVVSRAGLSRSDGGGRPNLAAVANTAGPERANTGAGPIAPGIEAAAAPTSVSAAADSTGSSISASSTAVARAAADLSFPSAPEEAAGDRGSALSIVAAPAGSRPSGDASGPAAATRSSEAPRRTLVAAGSASTQAENIQLASVPARSTTNEAAPSTSTSSAASRDTRGLPARTASTVPAGAPGLAMEAPLGSAQAVPAAGSPRDTNADQPAVNNVVAVAPLGRSTGAAIEAASTSALDVPDVGVAATETRTGSEGDTQPGPSTGPNAVERSASGGVPVQIASATGPGGLAAELSAVVGSRKTTAQRDSNVIHDADTRFLGREISGAVPAASFVRDAAKAFERRGRENGTGEGQPGAKTEEAIERGLEFLARAQQADGSWSFQKFPGATADDEGMIHSDTAATGLALMAFLGGGYDHFEDKHRDTVRRGLQFLLRQQDESGDLYVAQDPKSHESAWLYSHAIASIAMTEALGMTGDQELRGPAQRAIEFIEAAQDQQYGGWRYSPGVSSDTSVSGWMLMALKSGELAGLTIKPETYDGVKKWLQLAQASRNDGSEYVYNPYAPNTPDKRHGRRPSPAMTSVGLLMRLYLGWDRTRPEFKRGAEELLASPAGFGTTANPTRDTYYWYYATQVMFHMRGNYWKQWNDKLYPLLTSTQLQQGLLAGSWNPGGNVADRWGPQGGRIYVTTMNLLSLEVYYRHLPIYEETAK